MSYYGEQFYTLTLILKLTENFIFMHHDTSLGVTVNIQQLLCGWQG